MESITKYRYINFLWACLVFLMASLPVTLQILKVVLTIFCVIDYKKRRCIERR